MLAASNFDLQPAEASDGEVTRRFYETLLVTERLPAARLEQYQHKLVRRLLAYASQLDFYAEALRPLLKQAGTIDMDGWRQLPTIDRTLLTKRIDAISAREPPKLLGEVKAIRSGGSTGQPLRLAQSGLESLARTAITFRIFAAYQFDLRLPLLMLRNPQFGAGRTDRLAFRRWGFTWCDESELGPRLHIDLRSPIANQFSAVAANAPLYLNTLPSNLLRLGLEAQRRDEYPSIPYILSVAEYLAPEVRQFAEKNFGGKVIDILSSAEGGIIAVECPVSGQYHIQSEIVVAEILNERGHPCGPGEIGELVVTPLYNYVTPLIRYRSGDFVMAGQACACGRTLPTIARIIGRKEHMFAFPDGQRKIPPIDRVRVSQLLGHDEWQLVQTAYRNVSFRHAGTRLTRQLAAEVTDLVRQAVGEEFAVDLQAGIGVPLTPGGKRHYTINATSAA